MFSVKIFIVCAIGFLLGNAIGGTFVGALFAAALVTATCFKSRIKRVNLSVSGTAPLTPTTPQQKAEQLQRLNEKYGDLKPPPQLHRLFFVWFGVIALALPYDIILTLAHNVGALNAWLAIFQPAVDWLGAYVPAIERIPAKLDAIGYSAWAPVVQHALFFNWVTAGPMLIWMTIDVWFFRRSMWTDSTTGAGTDFALAAVASAVLVFIMLVMLFFGSVLSPLLDSFAGIGLVGKTFLFLFLAFLLYAFLLSTASLVRLMSSRNASRLEADEERNSRSERMAALRNAFRRPRKADAR